MQLKDDLFPIYELLVLILGKVRVVFWKGFV